MPCITICMGAPSPAALLPTTAVICRLSSCPSSGTSLLPLLVHVALRKEMGEMPVWSKLRTSSGGMRSTGTRSPLGVFIMMTRGRSRPMVKASRWMKSSCSASTPGGSFRATVVATRNEKPHLWRCRRSHSTCTFQR